MKMQNQTRKKRTANIITFSKEIQLTYQFYPLDGPQQHLPPQKKK